MQKTYVVIMLPVHHCLPLLNFNCLNSFQEIFNGHIIGGNNTFLIFYFVVKEDLIRNGFYVF